MTHLTLLIPFTIIIGMFFSTLFEPSVTTELDKQETNTLLENRTEMEKKFEELQRNLKGLVALFTRMDRNIASLQVMENLTRTLITSNIAAWKQADEAILQNITFLTQQVDDRFLRLENGVKVIKNNISNLENLDRKSWEIERKLLNLSSEISHMNEKLSDIAYSTKDSDPANVSLSISEAYIDVKVHETIYIKCSGSPPLKWDYKSPTGSEIKGYSEEMFDSGNESVIRLTFEYQDATGRYICKNNHSEASVYIFVNGEELLLVEVTSYISYVNKYIQCIPTASGVNMTLWKKYENGTRVPVQLEFDKTKGFLVTSDSNFFNGLFECAAEFDGRISTYMIEVEFAPKATAAPEVTIISSNATYIMFGSSFSLTCVVRTDLHAHVYVTWGYPNRDTARNNEATKSNADEQYRYINKTLIIFHATPEDTGSYICTAVDHSGLKNTSQWNITVHDDA